MGCDARPWTGARLVVIYSAIAELHSEAVYNDGATDWNVPKAVLADTDPCNHRWEWLKSGDAPSTLYKYKHKCPHIISFLSQ